MRVLPKALRARAAVSLALVAALILAAFALPAPARAADMPMFPWRGYTLGAEMATDDPATVNFTSSKRPSGARFVLVRFSGLGEMIAMSDIEAYSDEFALRDADGAEYTPDGWSVGRLRITSDKISMADQQEWFGLIFYIPTNTPVDGLTLFVATEKVNERITLGLGKVSRGAEAEATESAAPAAEQTAAAEDADSADEAEEEEEVPDWLRGDAPKRTAAPVTPRPTLAPTPTPVPTPTAPVVLSSVPLGKRVVAAIGDDQYAQAYETLAEGKPVKRGSSGQTARAVQRLLVALGASISVDGEIGSKTIAAMKTVAGGYLSPNEQGELPAQVDQKVFEELLTLLLLETDRDTGTRLLAESGEDMDSMLAFLEAMDQADAGNYFTAKRMYEALGAYRGSDVHAANCAQAWPKNAELYRNPQYSPDSLFTADLTMRAEQPSGEATFVKIYSSDGATLVSTSFIGGSGRVKLRLPVQSSYIVKTGSGSAWYGPNEAFGQGGDAVYSRLNFETGNTMNLEYNGRYTLTLFGVTDGNVGSQGESWGDF